LGKLQSEQDGKRQVRVSNTGGVREGNHRKMSLK
jgi:hypothetical protein